MGRFQKLFTSVFLVGLLAGALPVAAQTVTTIRDTVKNADGSNFYGRAIVSWQGFTAASGATVAPNSTTVAITNGYLSIVLVPTTNASSGAYYTVQYASNDGTKLWTEYWAVPPSWTALTISQVRVSNPPSSGGNGGPSGGITLPISEADVRNLLSDLAARPTKSALVTPSRAAMFDAAGNIGSISGNPVDCVHVDGTSGACGSGASVSVSAAFVDGETPSGTLNGSNVSFTLSQAPSPALSLSLYRNGITLRQGVDYSLSTNTVTFIPAAAPQPGDLLTAFYRVPGGPVPLAFADAEVPAGTMDGSNATFTLVSAPSPAASLQLFKNGTLLTVTKDYTLSGTTITFFGTAIPQSGDKVQAFYRNGAGRVSDSIRGCTGIAHFRSLTLPAPF
jgi:hypothetical protein